MRYENIFGKFNGNFSIRSISTKREEPQEFEVAQRYLAVFLVDQYDTLGEVYEYILELLVQALHRVNLEEHILVLELNYIA
jgi:hypothetical protein